VVSLEAALGLERDLDGVVVAVLAVALVMHGRRRVTVVAGGRRVVQVLAVGGVRRVHGRGSSGEEDQAAHHNVSLHDSRNADGRSSRVEVGEGANGKCRI